jgi:transposase
MVIRSPSGRKRWNVLGAINAVSHELITVTNETYINAESVCELLYKVAALGLQLPITFILDNTRYQRCARVKEVAAACGIELLFLPPYWPNLNLIERLWKFVKKQCLYAKYYETFTDFKQAIESCLTEIAGIHKDELESLLSLKFQTFQNLNL